MSVHALSQLVLITVRLLPVLATMDRHPCAFACSKVQSGSPWHCRVTLGCTLKSHKVEYMSPGHAL